MKRPSQIALTLLGCALLIGSIYTLSARVIADGFQRVELVSVRDNVRRMKHAMSDQIARLGSVAAPWSQWNEACEFANAPHPLQTSFAREEISASALANLASNAIVYARRDGRIVFAAGYDIKSSHFRPFPRGLRDFLRRQPALLHHRDFRSRKSGILMLPEGALMFASQPLLVSGATGQVQGSFFVGRFLDAGIASQMSQRVENLVQVRALSSDLPIDFADARAELAPATNQNPASKTATKAQPDAAAIRALSENTIAGYALVDDWSGHPALLARVSAPRLVYAQARQSLTALLWSISGIGAIGMLLLLLAQTRVTRARREREEEQTRFRAVFEGLGEGVILTDLNDVVSNTNARLQEITGYNAGEMIGRPAYELLLPRDKWPALENRNLQRRNGHSEVYEAPMQRRDGATFWALVHATPLRDASGQVVGTIGALTDISARKEAERRLHESEERLRTIVTNAPIVLFALDRDGIFTLSEGRGLTEFGLKAGEVVGRAAREIYADFPEICAGLQGALAGKAVLNTSEIDGKTWESRYTPIRDASGQVSGLIGVSTDVTERVEAQTRLRDSEMRFRSVVETATDAIVLADGEGTILSWNRGAQLVFGYEASEAIGAPFSLLVPQRSPIGPDESDDYTSNLVAAKSENPLAGRALELTARRKDGAEFPIEMMMDVWNLGDRPFHASILRDISARKAMELQLRGALAERRLIMEAIPDVIFRLNTKGQLVSWNRKLEETTGLEPAQLQNRGAVEFFAPTDASRIAAAIEMAITEGFAEVEAALLRPDREPLPMAWTAVPLHDEQGRFLGITGSGRDITERQKAEASIRAALVEKEVLLKEIHHRVKNNLQIISSLLSWQSDVLSDPVAREALDDSRQRVRSMALIHEKLYQSDDLAHIDFSEYLANLCQSLMRSYSDKGARVSLDLQVESVQLNVDLAVPCGLIINELVTNALKYAFPGGRSGTITVALGEVEDGHIELSVADDGVGIPAGWNVEESESIGTQLVTGLCSQLEGTYALDGSAGTRWAIRFKHLS